MSIEIELRYEVINPRQLISFVAPFKFLHRRRDTDVYLDTSDALLYRRGIFIRMRNSKKLDVKFNRECLDNPNLAMQDYCEEHSFTLPLQSNDLTRLNRLLVSLELKPCWNASLDDVKAENGFGDHYIVDKVRSTYLAHGFTLSIDEVADLGTFLEIELLSDTAENIATIKKTMESLLSNLSLNPLRTGYGTLLLRKHNFNHYMLGRFILEEDRKEKRYSGS